MRRPIRRALVLAIAILVVLAAITPMAFRYLQGASLIVRAAGLHGTWPDRLARWNVHEFTARDVTVPSRSGPLRARLYVPAGRVVRTLVLTPGVHADGMDEPRLAKFARDFATSGLAVLTPELPDLLSYQVTPRLADQIEDAASWVIGQPELAPDGLVGLVGISFAGGLSVVAAGREGIRDRVAYVMSFGGHGDLARTLRYLCTGLQPDGTVRTPHDYGVVVILMNAAPFVVPLEQVEPLRAGIRIFMKASHVDMVDKDAAAGIFREAIDLEPSLPEPARTYLHWVNTRDVKQLGTLLLPIIDKTTVSPALSPERSPAPRRRALLLHGADDNVVPAVEATLLARYLESQGTPTTALVTSLITHAEIDRPPTMMDVVRLVDFWSRLLK